MDDPWVRVVILLRLLVPFLFMMASVYLTTHIVFARFITSPQSQVLWFFAVVTAPLTRPFRALLPAGTPERRVRAVALAAYVVLWIASDRLARTLLPLGAS